MVLNCTWCIYCIWIMARNSRPRPCHWFVILCIGDQGWFLWLLWCSCTLYFEYHVNVQINKIPQLAMELQREKDGGMISQGIGRGVSQTPWANRVWLDVNGETHEPSATFSPLSSIINFFQKLDEVVNALGRARHGSLTAFLRNPGRPHSCFCNK